LILRADSRLLLVVDPSVRLCATHQLGKTLVLRQNLPKRLEHDAFAFDQAAVSGRHGGGWLDRLELTHDALPPRDPFALRGCGIVRIALRSKRRDAGLHPALVVRLRRCACGCRRHERPEQEK
jgi:hypothetical protein